MPLPHHISREPRPYDRGLAFGTAQAEAVARNVSTYRRMLGELREAGERVADRLDEDLRLELEGIAAGAGVDPLELAAINARTELLGGCSLIARDGWLAQTWDWHPDCVAVVWTIMRDDGSWLTTVTEAGVVAKLGVNSAGLACGLNFLTCSADGGTDGTPIHVLLRRVLETSSAAEARALLLEARVSASSCVTVVCGEVFAVELSPGGSSVVTPDHDGWLVHTNHFLLAPPAGVDTQPAGSRARRAVLARAVREGRAAPDVLRLHEPAVQPVCRHGDGTSWEERRATLLAIWAEPPRLRVAAGPPCSAEFVPVVR